MSYEFYSRCYWHTFEEANSNVSKTHNSSLITHNSLKRLHFKNTGIASPQVNGSCRPPSISW